VRSVPADVIAVSAVLEHRSRKPSGVYVWLVLTPNPVLPSPKLRVYEMIEPPVSAVALASKATVSGRFRKP